MDTEEAKSVIKIGFSNNTISQCKAIIRDAVKSTQQCFWPDIVKENNGRFSLMAIHIASKQMQENKTLRLREDANEHAMEYICANF